MPRAEAKGHIQPVVAIEAQIVQRRRIGAGDRVGYNATFTAAGPMELAIVNLGYADGYVRGFRGAARRRPVSIRLSAAYRWT
jgi:alanine racemase